MLKSAYNIHNHGKPLQYEQPIEINYNMTEYAEVKKNGVMYLQFRRAVNIFMEKLQNQRRNRNHLVNTQRIKMRRSSFSNGYFIKL